MDSRQFGGGPIRQNTAQCPIAYNAALQLGTAALAACGYRSSREPHHFRIIQTLTLTIGADARFVNTLEAFRKKRNVSDYERAGAVSEIEVREMIALARQLQGRVRKWLQETHPDLLL